MAERPEDLNLPNAVIARIIKDAVPEGVNVAKDARLAISKAASVFVLYATSCANNFAMKNKRKTISSQDVISAMSDMEFDRFIEPLNKCIEAYKSAQKDKKEATAKRKSGGTTIVEDEGKPAESSPPPLRPAPAKPQPEVVTIESGSSENGSNVGDVEGQKDSEDDSS